MATVNRKKNIYLIPPLEILLTTLTVINKINDFGANTKSYKRIGGIMASMLTLSVVDCELEPWSGQTKDYKTGICSFSAKHAAIRRKGKDWLAQNQNNVSKLSDMSTCRLVLVSYHYKNPTQRIGLEQSRPHHHLDN
jgi:hypothetical protein